MGHASDLESSIGTLSLVKGFVPTYPPRQFLKPHAIKAQSEGDVKRSIQKCLVAFHRLSIRRKVGHVGSFSGVSCLQSIPPHVFHGKSFHGKPEGYEIFVLPCAAIDAL